MRDDRFGSSVPLSHNGTEGIQPSLASYLSPADEEVQGVPHRLISTGPHRSPRDSHKHVAWSSLPIEGRLKSSSRPDLCQLYQSYLRP